MLQLVDRLLGRPRPVILMYHRVATPTVDPWGLAVSPANFASQVETVAANRAVIPMEEFAARHVAGTLPRDALALTFDDGYADNLVNAAPIMAERGVPATIFVATGYVGRVREYWWDELARLVLLHQGVADWRLDGWDGPLQLQDEAVATDWQAERPATTERQRLFLQLWAHLRWLELSAIEAMLDELAAQSHAPPPVAIDLPSGRDALAAASDAGHVSLGAHSVTHRPLTTLASAELAAELVEGLRDVEAIAGRKVTGLAYPYGDCNEAVGVAARQAGIGWACTTRSVTVRGDSDPMFLPRVQAPDCSGQELLRRLNRVRSA